MRYQEISHSAGKLDALIQRVFTVSFNIITSHYEDRFISMQSINFMYIEIFFSLSLTVCVCVCVHLVYTRSEQEHMGCVGVLWQRTATLPPLQQRQETLHFISASKILNIKLKLS